MKHTLSPGLLALLATLLSACASSADQASFGAMEEKYVPTGSNIPRKSHAANGNTDRLTKDQFENSLRTAPSANGKLPN